MKRSMAKFSDLEPERQRKLMSLARCLELAIESLITSQRYMESRHTVRMQLVNQANFEIDQLSERQIADLVKKLDELNDAESN